MEAARGLVDARGVLYQQQFAIESMQLCLIFFTAGPSPVSETDLVQQYGAGLFGVIMVTPKQRK